MAAENQLSPDESNLVLAAMLQAQQAGDGDAVAALAGLAQDPAKLREALGAAGESGEESEEAPAPPPAKSAKALPRVPQLKKLPVPLFGTKSLTPAGAAVRDALARARGHGDPAPAELQQILTSAAGLSAPELAEAFRAAGLSPQPSKGAALKRVEFLLTQGARVRSQTAH